MNEQFQQVCWKYRRWGCFLLTVCFFFQVAISGTETIRTDSILGSATVLKSKLQGRKYPNDNCPCISKYLKTLKNLGVANGNMTYSTWEKALCLPPPDHVSDKPLIFGVGPGTTATRSVALAVSLLRKNTLHWGVVRAANGKYHWDWDDGKNLLDRFGANQLVLGMKNLSTWESIPSTMNFAQIFEPLDAVFDYPFPMYALDVLRYFPQAKVIMTHRDPFQWYDQRMKFCTGKHPLCSVPFLLRPLKLSMNMREWTKDKAAVTFAATETAIQCFVGRERFLRVDVWNPPAGGWMPILAEFLDVLPIPTQESNCTMPRRTNHDLKCEQGEPACAGCNRFFRSAS